MFRSNLNNFSFATVSPRHWAPVLATLLLLPLASTAAKAVEVLSIHELVSHCERLEAEPEGADAQYCIRYIQGFIDGAVATDARVMINIETAVEGEETFSERAKRTRVPSRAERLRAAELAGFCLGDPLPLKNVVKVVVNDLTTLDQGASANSPAREALYQSLQDHYPCTPTP